MRIDPFSFHKTIADIDFDLHTDLSAVTRRRQLMQPELSFDMSSSQRHWSALLHGRVELLPTAELALNTMLIQQGIYRAHELAREVTASEVVDHPTSTAASV